MADWEMKAKISVLGAALFFFICLFPVKGITQENSTAEKNATMEDGLRSRLMELDNDLYLLQKKVSKEEKKRESMQKTLHQIEKGLEKNQSKLVALKGKYEQLNKDILQMDEVVYSIKNDYSGVVEEVHSVQTKMEKLQSKWSSKLDGMEKEVNKVQSGLATFKEETQVQLNAVNDAVGSGISNLEKKVAEFKDVLQKRKKELARVKEKNLGVEKSVRSLNGTVGQLEKDLREFREKSTGRQNKLFLFLRERIMLWGSIALAVLGIIMVYLLIRLTLLARKVRSLEAGARSEVDLEKSPEGEEAFGWLTSRQGEKEE